jgi:hypothetical protein
MKYVLSINHPRFREFAHTLDAWISNKGCSGYHISTQLMEEMGDIDVPETLEYFRAKGGGCDCEILNNIAFPEA